MELNAEDKGNREFILVQIDEEIKELSEMNKEHDTNKEQASNTNGMSKGGK